MPRERLRRQPGGQHTDAVRDQFDDRPAQRQVSGRDWARAVRDRAELGWQERLRHQPQHRHADTIGILVQRTVGKHIVTIGRVPLGHHRAGHLALRWNLRVDGHPLPAGHDLITLRALAATGQVIALTAPVKITINAKKRRKAFDGHP